MISSLHVLRTRLAEVQLAIMLLTRLPAGHIAPPAPVISSAAWAFPLAGLIVGSIVASVLAGTSWIGLPPEISAGIALAAGIAVTGGLHEDGLADTADGFGGGRDRDHKLAIMRDSRIGSFGTLALILTLGLRWSALTMLTGHDAESAACTIVAIAVASRAGFPAILAWLPPARSDGLGHAASSAAPAQAGARAAIAAAIGLSALGLLLSPAVALAIAIGLVAVHVLLAWLALKQIGGQTGDILGAMQQAADVCALIVVVWFSR